MKFCKKYLKKIQNFKSISSPQVSSDATICDLFFQIFLGGRPPRTPRRVRWAARSGYGVPPIRWQPWTRENPLLPLALCVHMFITLATPLLFHLSAVDVKLPSEPGVGKMPVLHLRMLGRHHANYNMQDTVLAQLLYHMNTAHINASVSRVRTTLVHHLQMLAQRCTSNCAEDHHSGYHATCTLTYLHGNHWPPLSSNRNRARH